MHCSEISVNDFINIPKPSDKETWTNLDKTLFEELPINMAGSTPCEQLDNLENYVYKVLLDKFGIRPTPNIKKTQPEKSRQLKKLRLLKKQAKREFKKAIKNGDQATLKERKQDFHKLIRIHNKVRKLELEKHQKLSRNITYSRFRKNPHQFAKTLFSKPDESKPTFPKKAAEKYFSTTYSDNKREYKYHPLHGLKRPPVPEKQFNTKPPTISELQEYLNRRRNACSPGTNRIPYLVWKKCPLTVTLLHDVLCKIWKGNAIPISWRVGETILISKNDDTSNPVNFRPITLKNSSGNLFMGILAQRCIRFLKDNKYIDTSIQKGFVEKIAGCIEHTEALTEILHDAKKTGNPIATTWLDLQNAYGSVPHNLIQFALEWYHVPEAIRKIVHNYYDESYIRVKTNDWTTDWIHCGIGVFQGCPLSCILFLAVFNLCLDLLKEHNNLGYHIRGTSITSTVKAYADDLTLITKNPTDNQKLLDVVDTFLKWTRTMKAKPSKCRSHAMKKSVPNTRQRQQGQRSHYSPFDPLLKINGENIAYIHSEPIKFLGKLIYKDLKDDEIRLKVKKKLNDMLVTTDKCQLSGIMKMWIYNNAIIPRVTWEFTIYNFPVTFVEGLEAICTKYLKKWAGICRSMTVSALYRSRDRFGLQLKRLTTSVKCMQVTKYHLNKYSSDDNTKTIYRECMKSKMKLSRWNGVKELEERERHLIINEMCRGQHDRAGLGFHRHHTLTKSMQPSEHRKSLTNLVKEVAEDDMIVYLHSCAKQGQFLKWDTAMQVDTSWKKLLYVWSPELLSFHINAIHDLLPSPANLRLWGKTDIGTCQLCHYHNCTLFHILNGCNYSLHNGRYNWRHDQTLKIIASGLLPFIKDAINQSADEIGTTHHYTKTPLFRTTHGKTFKNPDLPLVKDPESDILSRANDWILLMDEEYNQVAFPPQIYETAKRPDITIHSPKTKTVIIIELTVPIEENLSNANIRKKCKYEDLVAECENRKWHTYYFPVEVGSRGFYNTSLTKCLTALGIPKGHRKPILDEASRTALRASYFIWLNRNNKDFHRCHLTNTQREEGRLSAQETGLTHQSLVRSPETSKGATNKSIYPDTGLKTQRSTIVTDTTGNGYGPSNNHQSLAQSPETDDTFNDLMAQRSTIVTDITGNGYDQPERHQSLVRSPETSHTSNGLKTQRSTIVTDTTGNGYDQLENHQSLARGRDTSVKPSEPKVQKSTIASDNTGSGAEKPFSPYSFTTQPTPSFITTNYDDHSAEMTTTYEDQEGITNHLSDSSHLREMLIPYDLVPQFSKVASNNTQWNIETCGILSGKTTHGAFLITHLLIPKQSGTANSCSAEGEEEILEYQLDRELITMGWIHTHPSQTAFLSSVDVHTHCPYQLMMPEAIAIVHSAKFQETGYYHLTPDYGLHYITNCHRTGFHPHVEWPPVFETAPHTVDKDTNITIVDLR